MYTDSISTLRMSEVLVGWNPKLDKDGFAEHQNAFYLSEAGPAEFIKFENDFMFSLFKTILATAGAKEERSRKKAGWGNLSSLSRCRQQNNNNLYFFLELVCCKKDKKT